MSLVYNKIGPSLIDNEMLKTAVEEQGPKQQAGRIAKAEGIDYKDVTRLRLELKNILKIDNLWHFQNLTKLQLNNNIIEKIQGLDTLVNLVWLDLSFNNIEEIEGLDALTKLESLSLYNNRISLISNMDNLKNLLLLSLGNNNLTSLQNITYLRRFKALRSLNIFGNPLCEDAQHTFFIAAHLQDLMYLDFRLLDENIKALAILKFQYSLEGLEHNEAIEKRNQEEEEQKQRELDLHKAAFVEYLNGAALVESMYSEDTDGTMISTLPGVTEIMEEFRTKCGAVCQKIFEYGLSHHEKREAEVSVFNECLEEAKTENQEAAAKKVQEFVEKNSEILDELSQITDAQILDSKIFKYKDEITQLKYTLMLLEFQLVDQLEEIIKDFERNILEMASTFLETIQGLVTQIRNLENHHHELLSDICMKINDQFLSRENGDDMTDDLRVLLSDKDSIVNALGASHDIHLLKINNREDELVTKINNWAKNVIQKVQNDEIQRNHKRVTEIYVYMDHLLEELDNLDLHEQI